MIINKKYLILVIMALSSLVANPTIRDVQYVIYDNGFEIQIDYSEPISEDDIIAWKTDRGRMVITLLDIGGASELEPALFFPDPLTSLFLDDFDGSTQLAFTFKQPILGFDIFTNSTLEKSTVFLHLAESQEHVESLKQELGLQIPGQENRELEISFPEYFEVDLKEAMDWAQKDLGYNSLFNFHGSIVSTNPKTVTYMSALNDEPILRNTELKDQESPASATIPKRKDNNIIEEQIETDPLTISTNWLQIEEPDELFFPPETITESQTIPVPKTKNKKIIQQEPTNWIDVESAFSTSKDVDDLMYPIELDPIPTQIVEPSQSELDEKKWYSVQQRYKARVKAGIRVLTNLKGVPIYIDGKLVGESPLRGPIRVKPGWHQVSGYSPLYARVMNTVGIDELGLDPLAKNNQLFGSQTVYVEAGNVSVVNLKFNKISEQPMSRKHKDGGMAIGFPIIMVIFGLITWGLI